MKLVGNGGLRPMEQPEERCRKWQIWQGVEAGGERAQRTEVFHGGKRAALKRKEEFRAELEAAVPNGETVRAYCDRWLEWQRDFGDYSPDSLKDYRAYLNSVCHVLGGRRLDSLDAGLCKRAFSALKHGGGPSGRELSGATMSAYFTVFNLVMSAAETEGAISANPLAQLSHPKVDTGERGFLSPAELDGLWERACAMRLDGRTCALLAAMDLGMRRKELVCQLDADVVGKVLVVSESKTRSGKGRTLPLTDRLASKIEEWRGIRRRSGIGDAERLFCDMDGTSPSADAFGVWAKAALGKLGYEGMTLHSLRHSNLSKMARYMGVYDLQRWAGWSSIAPAKRYVHDDFSQLESAVRRSQMRAIVQKSERNVANMLHDEDVAEIL